MISATLIEYLNLAEHTTNVLSFSAYVGAHRMHRGDDSNWMEISLEDFHTCFHLWVIKIYSIWRNKNAHSFPSLFHWPKIIVLENRVYWMRMHLFIHHVHIKGIFRIYCSGNIVFKCVNELVKIIQVNSTHYIKCEKKKKVAVNHRMYKIYKEIDRIFKPKCWMLSKWAFYYQTSQWIILQKRTQS